MKMKSDGKVTDRPPEGREAVPEDAIGGACRHRDRKEQEAGSDALFTHQELVQDASLHARESYQHTPPVPPMARLSRTRLETLDENAMHRTPSHLLAVASWAGGRCAGQPQKIPVVAVDLGEQLVDVG